MTDYTYWRNALAGQFGPVHDGDPQCGFYKARMDKNGPWVPVAIWQDAGELMQAAHGEMPVDASSIWTWCCQKPISEEVYRYVRNGGSWPDAIEEIDINRLGLAVGSNNAPPGEAEADEIQSAIDAALAQLKAPLITQVDCDKLANHRDRLAKMYKAQETYRKAEKQPHMDAASAVDAKYKPVLARIEDAGKSVKDAISAWLMKESDRLSIEFYTKREAEEAARKAVIDAGLPAPEPAPVVEIARPKAGTTGRATALRTYKSAVIVDYAAALKHFADDPLVRMLIQTLASQLARAGVAAPGCIIKEEQRAS